MTAASGFFHHYGSWVIFGAVLVEQLGLPFPSAPLLIAGGVMAGTGQLHFERLLLFGVVASLLGDSFWFFLGRWQGRRVLQFLCRISLEPDACVRHTEERFLRHGTTSLVVGKFLPGIGTVIRPLAAIAGVTVSDFLLYDALGSILYIGAYLLMGYIFSPYIDAIIFWMHLVGRALLWTLAGIVCVYVVYKYVRRRQLLRSLAMARIPAEELRTRLEGGDTPTVVDLRSPLQIKSFPFRIPGAQLSTIETLVESTQTLPADREVVVYCDCPNEESAARAVQLLRRRGLNARPLLGGIGRWKDNQFPLEPLPAVVVEQTELAVSNDNRTL